MRNSCWSVFGKFALFSLFYAVIAAAVGYISMVFLGPNLLGLGIPLLVLIISTPFVYVLYGLLIFRWKKQCRWGFGLPLLIFPVIFSLVFAYTALVSLNPENLFRELVIDPTPPGVTQIKAADISMGIDSETVIAFHTTPEVLDQIILEHQLAFGDVGIRSDHSNFEGYFPGVDWDPDWILYSNKTESSYFDLWISPDKTIAIVDCGAG